VSDALTVPVKYIFLDVVNYTLGRSVEAQCEIIATLNEIVKTSVREIPSDNIILIPAGDGICVALLNIETPYDIHLQVALSIIKSIDDYSKNNVDPMRRFKVRIGINSNIDNIVTDINGNKNLAGAGINIASRIMDCADGSQILVSESVYETMHYRERYMKSFTQFSGRGKHGVVLNIFQYIAEGHPELNTAVPAKFIVKPREEDRLSKMLGYCFAHAIKNKDFIVSKAHDFMRTETTCTLLWLLAIDSYEKAVSDGLSVISPQTYRAGMASFGEQYEYYNSADLQVLRLCFNFISKNLDKYWGCFARATFGQYIFINEIGKEKLRRDCADICSEFSI
jgi:hypothetical protein